MQVSLNPVGEDELALKLSEFEEQIPEQHSRGCCCQQRHRPCQIALPKECRSSQEHRSQHCYCSLLCSLHLSQSLQRIIIRYCARSHAGVYFSDRCGCCVALRALLLNVKRAGGKGSAWTWYEFHHLAARCTLAGMLCETIQDFCALELPAVVPKRPTDEASWFWRVSGPATPPACQPLQPHIAAPVGTMVLCVCIHLLCPPGAR